MKPVLLYVEDDDNVRRAMMRLLEHEGFHVHETSTTIGAHVVIELHREGELCLAGILTDWNLVGETAEAIIGWARELGLPCLVMSGSAAKPGFLPWIVKSDTDGLRDWLRSVRSAVPA